VCLQIEKEGSVQTQKQLQLGKEQTFHVVWLGEPKAPKEDEQPNLGKSSEQ